MTNELATVNEMAIMPVMSLQQAAVRRQAIVDFTSSLMVKGTDYGIIPGTGNKPTLLKPGAEKLTTLFGLSPRFEVVNVTEDWTGEGHGGEPFFNYQYRCSLWRGELLVGQGEGSCNSWEKKYRYRTVYPDKATEDEKREGRLEQKMGKGGRPYNVYVVKNQNPADIVNTLQKMAQKRALVAATLIAVNASEFFTQDVEDMDFGSIIEGEYTEAPAKPERKSQKPADDLLNDALFGDESIPPKQIGQYPGKDPRSVDWREKALVARKEREFASAASFIMAWCEKGNANHIINALREMGDDWQYDATQNEAYLAYLEQRN